MHQLGTGGLRLRIGAPGAAQRAALQEDDAADAGAVMQGKPFDFHNLQIRLLASHRRAPCLKAHPVRRAPDGRKQR